MKVWIMRDQDGIRQIVGATEEQLSELYFSQGWSLDPQEEAAAIERGVGANVSAAGGNSKSKG